MPTKVLRTTKQYVANEGEELHQVGQTTELVDPPTQDTGQRLGGPSRPTAQAVQAVPAPQARRDTPPKEDTPSSDTDKPWFKARETPRTAYKVLPWRGLVDTLTAAVLESGLEQPPSPTPTVKKALEAHAAREQRAQAKAKPVRDDRTVQSASVPPPRHPFAYDPGSSQPFSALAHGTNMDADQVLAEQSGARPESDMLSRGAGVKYLNRPKDAVPGGGMVGPAETSNSGVSLGMGTFGRQASQDPLASSEILPPLPPKTPKAATHIPRKPPPQMTPAAPRARSAAGEAPPGRMEWETSPLAQAPRHEGAARTPRTRSRADTARQDDERHIPHVHQPHPEHPFSLEEAARKQAEAMAHLEAFQRLEAGYNPLASSNASGKKGPRQTFETATTSPSFGHLYHKDGVPLSRALSMEPDFALAEQDPTYPPPEHVAAELARLHGNAMFHIPFGPNMAVPFTHHLLYGPSSAHMDAHQGQPMASAGFARGRGLSDSPGEGQRRDNRSAYVETIRDEQEPTVAGAGTHPGTAAERSTIITHPYDAISPAKPESGIHPQSRGADSPARTRRTRDSPRHTHTHGQRSAAAPHSTRAPSAAPSLHEVAPEQAAQNIMYGQRYPPMGLGSPFDPRPHPGIPGLHSMTSGMPRHGTGTSQLQQPAQQEALRNTSFASAVPTVGTPAQVVRELEAERSPIAPSDVSVTTNILKHAVADSKFHDEILCQLLDAARLNLIGSEAKKALQRAARARVIELRDLRASGELTERDLVVPKSKAKREKRDKTKDRGRRGHSRQKSEPSEIGERPRSRAETSSGRTARQHHSHEPIPDVPPVPQARPPTHVNPPQGVPAGSTYSLQPATPPDWAQQIMLKLADMETRFAQNDLDQQHHHDRFASQGMGDSLLNELVFGKMPPSGVSPEVLQFSSGPMPMNPFDFPFSLMGQPPATGAQIRNITPDNEVREKEGHQLYWASDDVLLPGPNDRVSPPKTQMAGAPIAPTIRVQAPSDNMGRSAQARTVSAPGTKASETAPKRTEVDVIEEHTVELPDAAVPDPRDKDLPAQPAESVTSRKGVPAPTRAVKTSSNRGGDTPISLEEALGPAHAPPIPPQPIDVGLAQAPKMQPMPFRPRTDVPDSQTAYKTALQSPPRTPPRDRITINDPITSTRAEPSPWNLVTQRLYSWALVWEESTFARAMQEISLNKQVEEFALSIFVMMTYKRMLRRSLSELPIRACDKLFVPPTISDAINKAVHANNHNSAKQMLEELWYPFGFTEPPRVIIALARHLAEDDIWTAHRWDLTTAHLRSYKVCHDDRGHDGRPFMWWHAIRAAWPQYKIRHPSELAQQTTIIGTANMDKNDNSLLALSYARNLFLGFRPEHAVDIAKLRESVWTEVKRLLNKKRAGRLVIEYDSPSHGTQDIY